MSFAERIALTTTLMGSWGSYLTVPYLYWIVTVSDIQEHKNIITYEIKHIYLLVKFSRLPGNDKSIGPGLSSGIAHEMCTQGVS